MSPPRSTATSARPSRRHADDLRRHVVFYAAADRGDRSNARAKRVLSAGERLLTSDHVLVETWFLLAHRLGRALAERFWQTIRSGAASVEIVFAADLVVALALGEGFPDPD